MKFLKPADIIAFVAAGIKLPEWQTQLFAKYRNEIQVHSNGELFYKIDRLFPNEHPQSKEHRIISFEPITKGSFWKGVNNVQEVFHNSSYTISASVNTISYVNSHSFDQKNLFSFFLSKWCELALTTDPNALVVVYPDQYVKETGHPEIEFIGSEYIRYMDNETVVFISENESKIQKEFVTERVTTRAFYDESIDNLNVIETKKNTYASKLETKIVDPVYHVFTLDGLYRVFQTKDKDGNIIPDKWEGKFFKIGKNFIPVTRVGGSEAEKGIYESFFSSFVAFGNLALLMHSQHCAVNFMFSFPRMSELQTECDAPLCNEGWITLKNPDYSLYPEGRKQCNVCRGTGYTVKQSPYKVYQRKVDTNNLDEKTVQILNYDDVKFYTPPVEVLNYSKGEWKDYLELAEAAIYVSQKVQTGNVESAESKEMDRKDRYNFLSKISKVFYPCLRNIIQFYENYLNGSPYEVSIDIPYSLAIVSESEAFATLELMLNSNAPVLIKANEIENFINKFVSQSSPVKKFFSILKQVDILIYYTDDQLLKYKIGGVIDSQQLSIHAFAFPVLYRLYNQDVTILEKDEKVIIDLLNKELEQYKTKPTDLKSQLLSTLNQPEAQ